MDVSWISATERGSLRCLYLVGCDGGRSTVRKLGGFAFPSTAPTMTMYTAVVELDRPERLLPIGWRRTAGGVLSYGPFPDRLFLLDFSGPPADREAPVTVAEVEAVLRRIGEADVRVVAMESASRWTDNTRLADGYRRGRVFLAGDAAHVHSPFGGQGMSLGLVDAANLRWKLAAAVRGVAGDGLLDSYEAKRRPVAQAVLANTLAQAAIMRPDPQSGALRELFAGLLGLDEVNRRIGGMVSGLAARYDLGSAGDRAAGGTTLYEAMSDGAAVLLDASIDGRASAIVAALASPVRCLDAGTGPSMLIRPDGCVAWRGDGVEGLAAAARRWLIPSRAPSAAIPRLREAG